MADTVEISRLLCAWRDGDRGALDALTPLVYDELRRLAEHYMRKESRQPTIQATALVHEAYARVATVELGVTGRAQFMGFMARLMREILVDRARARNAFKRGSSFERVTLDEQLAIAEDNDTLVLDLDAVLKELRKFDETKARIIEMRFFGGMTYEETAAALDISTATLDRELRLAKAWLRHKLQGANV